MVSLRSLYMYDVGMFSIYGFVMVSIYIRWSIPRYVLYMHVVSLCSLWFRYVSIMTMCLVMFSIYEWLMDST